jgi:hypothetical protein
MTFNEVKNIVNDEVMLFKSGYEYIPFMADIGGKDDQVLGMIFEKFPLKRSTVGERDIAIDKKNMYKIHVDDVPMVMECLHRLYQKFNDQDMKDWIDDIEYHLKHFKRQDPL